MIFREMQFPTDISYGATGGPKWSTLVSESTGGAEYATQQWSQFRPEYDVSHSQNNPEKYARLLSFFNVMRAKKCAFRFKDWSDYTVAAGEGVFYALSGTTFQMYKRYSFPSEYFSGGTVTITGTGTSRTATVSGASPFYADDASAVIDDASFVMTAGGAQLQITAYTSATVVTVKTASTYVNESGVTYQKSRVYDHKITKPVVGTAVVTGGSGVSVNYTTGVVTVSSGTPTAFTAEFDQPCRFDIDHLNATISTYQTVDWQNIQIVGVKL